MSIFKEYNYLAASTNNICLLQNPDLNGHFILNGNLVNINTKTVRFLDDYGFVPKITFTSTDDMSTMSFKIVGSNNGVYIEEIITGPNNDTVTSVNVFDEIKNIVMLSLNLFNDVSVGTSGVGYFPLIRLNTLKSGVTNLNYALNMIVDAANPATYQVFLSLKDNYNQGTYDSLTVVNTDFIAPVAASNESALLNYTQLASNILIKVTPNNNGTALKAQFMQV